MKKLESGTEVTINVPFTYEIGETGPITGNELNTITDCKNEVLAELENGMSGDVLMNVRADNNTTPKFIQDMDWKQLQEQKLTLLHLIDKNLSLIVSDDLQSIVHILDAVQDYAVDELGIAEDVVFVI